MVSWTTDAFGETDLLVRIWQCLFIIRVKWLADDLISYLWNWIMLLHKIFMF